jgi:pyrroline-5-carboxylate reductase
MSLKNHIGIVGGGTMGSAMLYLLGEREICFPETCFVFDKNAERREALAGLPCAVIQTLDRLMEGSDVLILAVKPQDAPELFQQMRKSVSSHLIISIMAGVSISALMRGLGTERVVRAMPNMPARIGKGMTVWMTGLLITEEEKNMARAIFRALGEELEVLDEDLIDAATAISGSGPAYLFSLAEALEDAALQFKFSPEERRLLIRETLRGASELYAETDESPTSLRRAVTSQGGTTEAALQTLDLHHFATLWWRAIKEAHNRAKELNRV